MRVLVACEFSGIVRNAFLKLGHDAYSCDIRYDWSETAGRHRHTRGDVRPLLRRPWDLVIAHPPCTYLCNSGVRWLFNDGSRITQRWEYMEAACIFFKQCLNANAPMVCVENPIMHCYASTAIGVRYTQIIHPWQYGHGETKATCLWLKGLPRLRPTEIVPGRCPRIHTMSTRNRSKERSVTYGGIALAMATQWTR